MNAESPPRPMSHEEILEVRLGTLRQEHRDLDAAIEALQRDGGDAFTVTRLKKQKLALKDRISSLEDEATPDIIA